MQYSLYLADIQINFLEWKHHFWNWMQKAVNSSLSPLFHCNEWFRILPLFLQIIIISLNCLFCTLWNLRLPEIHSKWLSEPLYLPITSPNHCGVFRSTTKPGLNKRVRHISPEVQKLIIIKSGTSHNRLPITCPVRFQFLGWLFDPQAPGMILFIGLLGVYFECQNLLSNRKANVNGLAKWGLLYMNGAIFLSQNRLIHVIGHMCSHQ